MMPVQIDGFEMVKLDPWEKLNEKYWQAIIIAILVLGCLVRFQGIAFQLPFLYDEDESRRVDQAFRMIVRGDPNPRWFGHPASTLLYLLAILQLIIFFVGRLLGVFSNFEAFQNLYYLDPTIFYLTGRFLLIVCGTAGVFFTYLIGQKMFNQTIGIIGAILMAISPLHIKYSKIIRSDVLMVLFILIAFWYCLKILEEKNLKNYIWAGFFTGSAIVTKYPAALIWLTIPLAHFIKENWQLKELKKLLVSGLSCIGGAFIMSPFLFFNFSRALRNIRHESRSGNVGANGEGLISNLMWYWQNPLTNNFTFWGMLLLGLGLILCLFFPPRKKIVLVSFFGLFYIFISALSLRWNRWIIPLLPFASIIIAYTLYQLAEWLEKWSKRPLGFWLILIYLGCIIIPLAEINRTEFRELAGLDTRTVAREWILTHIPSQSSILVDEGTPPLSSQTNRLYEVKNGILSPIEPKQTRHDFIGADIKSISNLKNVKQIEEQKIEYIILSWKYFKYLEEANNYPAEIKTYQQIIAAAQLIHEVKREGEITSGPTVQIYKLNRARAFSTRGLIASQEYSRLTKS